MTLKHWLKKGGCNQFLDHPPCTVMAARQTSKDVGKLCGRPPIAIHFTALPEL